MSENMYDDEFETEQERTQEEENNKRRWVIPVSIAAIIALILALLFFLNKGDEDVEEPPVEETTSASVIPTDDPDTIAVDPSTTTEPGVVTESVTPGSGDEEEDTFFTGQAEPRYQEEPPTPLPTTATREDQLLMNPFDIESGNPGPISQVMVGDMFTMSPSMDKSYADNFNEKMEGRMTEQMKRTGFKKWWADDAPPHTSMYNSMAASGDGKIYAFPELKSERRVANDIIEYHYVVPQKIRTGGGSGYANIADFEVIVQMMGDESGKWLLNDYYFPEGRVPAIY